MNRLQTASYAMAFALIGLLSAGFILFDLARKSGWDWWDVLATVPAVSGRQDEIRKYVEFVTVVNETLRLKVVTGIRFNNSLSRKVEAQWCYAHPLSPGTGGLNYRLEIAETDASGRIEADRHSAQALSQFGLSSGQARTLVKDCRFR